ncbi:hypothetical protein KAU11_09865 [Candidatus Babeliales bacterium]|nr:hypothetical protein [Candidatus Babeliales bacterium]
MVDYNYILDLFDKYKIGVGFIAVHFFKAIELTKESRDIVKLIAPKQEFTSMEGIDQIGLGKILKKFSISEEYHTSNITYMIGFANYQLMKIEEIFNLNNDSIDLHKNIQRLGTFIKESTSFKPKSQNLKIILHGDNNDSKRLTLDYDPLVKEVIRYLTKIFDDRMFHYDGFRSLALEENNYDLESKRFKPLNIYRSQLALAFRDYLKEKKLIKEKKGEKIPIISNERAHFIGKIFALLGVLHNEDIFHTRIIARNQYDNYQNHREYLIKYVKGYISAGKKLT